MRKYLLKIKNLKLKFSLILASCFIILASQQVFAQAPAKGVSVTPSIAHIDLSQDPEQYLITYKNNFDSDITISLSAKDFTELEDSYRISFLNDNQNQNYRYSLSSWISFEYKTLELSPGEEKSVKIYIDKERITKGGHYASILAEIIHSENGKGINIKTVLSSLLFVRAATGKEIEEGKIFSLEALKDFIDYPKLYILRFQNSGNIHVVPYGLLQIYDPLGNLAAKGVVNEDSLDALPESIRNYKINTTTFQRVLLPGIYTAKIKVHFGKTNQNAEKTIKFFSSGSLDIVKTGGLLLSIIILIIILKRKLKKRPPQNLKS